MFGAAASKFELGPDYYPPAKTGLRGSHDGSWETMHARVSGTKWPKTAPNDEFDLVVVGADRIAKNVDVANKIGTYGLAVLARHHGIPMCVAAPRSTIDVKMATGADIPIEERGRNEVASPFGETILPDGVAVRHPAFDVSPADLISAIVTEVGVARPPYEDSLEALMAK